MAPVGGQAITGARLVGKVVNVATDGAKVIDKTTDFAKIGDEIVETGKKNVNDVVKETGETVKAEIEWPSRPHSNGTEGHWETIQQKANELANSGQYEKIYVNKGLSNEIPGATPNRRPDIMAVKPDGSIDQFEVPSKTDTIKGLLDRMTDNTRILGDRAGDIEVVPIK